MINFNDTFVNNTLFIYNIFSIEKCINKTVKLSNLSSPDMMTITIWQVDHTNYLFPLKKNF